MMLMMPKGYEKLAADTKPCPATDERMIGFVDSLRKAGVLLAVDSLYPPGAQEAARVSFADGGKTQVRDGPFSEAKEIVGGYWLIDVRSKEEAIEWARRCPAGDGMTIEVRRVHEAGDFAHT
jgi:hypothetical protein